VTSRPPSPVRWRALAAAAAVVVGLATAACSSTAAPTPTPPAPATATPQPARVIDRGDPSRRVVALTFDAAGGAGHTDEILAELRREGVRANFSVTGLWAEQHPDLLNAIAADGHLLINGSYHHASFTGRSTGDPPLNAKDRSLEISRTETTVYHLAGRTTRPYFRPPYGDIDASVQRDAADGGYGFLITWTVDSLGWQGAPADAIVERCLRQAEPGAIFVMRIDAASADAAALPGVIAGLRAAGYGFATIDELVR
jgi:peptidoglycan/xylan/chitin deacetylase (PgdA/CDA1 family)